MLKKAYCSWPIPSPVTTWPKPCWIELRLVRGVFDESQAKSNLDREFEHLLENEVDARLDSNLLAMHHKVILIDERIAVIGSYNFSNNAKTRNDENTLIVHSSEISTLDMEEFERVWREAEDQPR